MVVCKPALVFSLAQSEHNILYETPFTFILLTNASLVQLFLFHSLEPIIIVDKAPLSQGVHDLDDILAVIYPRVVPALKLQSKVALHILQTLGKIR